MNSGWARFGDPGRFQICLRWAEDDTPKPERPDHGGWSTGCVRLVVGGNNLTSHQRGQAEAHEMCWYLLPLFEWLARNWVPLLHEEQFAWRENAVVSAATATFLAMRRLFHATSEIDKASYGHVQAWRSRHALRAADPSGLYPDVFLRRVGEDIEVSWTARQPGYAPSGFRLHSGPGSARIAVGDVAGPLWEALSWAVSTAPVADAGDRASVRALERAISTLDALPTRQLAESYLRPAVREKVGGALAGRAASSTRMERAPAIDTLDDAVLMFGGVSPDINVADAAMLVGFLDEQLGKAEHFALSRLVDVEVGSPLAAAYSEGYSLAENLLDELDIQGSARFVDVAGILRRLGVEVFRQALSTDSIRGAAVAGARYGPAVLVNTTSPYNQGHAGERFTLAHELCHILYDRSRARRVAHTSGPWAEAGVERRANAFAAMLLMPRDLLRSVLTAGTPSAGEVTQAATTMRVGRSALIEHLYNTDMIDEFGRDALRS